MKADSKKTNQIKLFQKEFWELSKNEQVYKQALVDWIDFCKLFLAAYCSTATSDFDYSHFKDGKKKTGVKNLHTLYFEQLFSVDNERANFPLKLNWEAELFFRPKTDEDK